jgi:hypothetical protein
MESPDSLRTLQKCNAKAFKLNVEPAGRTVLSRLATGNANCGRAGRGAIVSPTTLEYLDGTYCITLLRLPGRYIGHLNAT